MELDLSYLRSQSGDSVQDMRWNLLVKPDAPVIRVIQQISALIKSMTNKTISNDFNSYVMALMDNRSSLTVR